MVSGSGDDARLSAKIDDNLASVRSVSGEGAWLAHTGQIRGFCRTRSRHHDRTGDRNIEHACTINVPWWQTGIRGESPVALGPRSSVIGQRVSVTRHCGTRVAPVRNILALD